MRLLPFKKSAECSIGIELEFQIINPSTFAHVFRAKDLIRHIKEHPLEAHIKPEITQSMIEINSSIHHSMKEMNDELMGLKFFLTELAEKLGIGICGGGTHPFQRWSTEKIFPTKRFKNLSAKFRYLSKRSTVFGQHIHIGCTNTEDAIYLTHALARYIPQLIAIAASSPFYQGIDTGYASSRVNVFNAFPQSGVMPYLTNWQDFSKYYYMMQKSGIIKTMKDFYWDIRPKPEFGTVEIRTLDTPLSIKKSVILGAYVQALALYLIKERPVIINKDLYYFYSHNRFEASRYGFEGDYIDAESKTKTRIQQDILQTIPKIERYANQLNNMPFLIQLIDDVKNNRNDSDLLRRKYKETGSLVSAAAEQYHQWLNEIIS